MRAWLDRCGYTGINHSLLRTRIRWATQHINTLFYFYVTCEGLISTNLTSENSTVNFNQRPPRKMDLNCYFCESGALESVQNKTSDKSCLHEFISVLSLATRYSQYKHDRLVCCLLCKSDEQFTIFAFWNQIWTGNRVCNHWIYISHSRTLLKIRWITL